MSFEVYIKRTKERSSLFPKPFNTELAAYKAIYKSLCAKKDFASQSSWGVWLCREVRVRKTRVGK